MHALDTTTALRLEGQTSRPEPFTAPEVDLKGFHFIPLDIRAFMDLDINVRASGEGFRCGVNLILAAWQQVPAGSLPKDEDLLCRAAGLGRDRASWREISAEALAQWVECSDDRLYHPVLSQWVASSWAQKKKNENRTRGATAGRAARRAEQANDNASPTSRQRDDDVTSAKSARDVHQERGRGKEKKGEGVVAAGAAPEIAETEHEPFPTEAPHDPATAIEFENGVVKITGAMLATWQKRYPGVNVLGKIETLATWINGQCRDGRKDWKELAATMLKKDYDAVQERALQLKARAEADAKQASKPKLALV